MQGEGILIPTYRNEHDRRGLRGIKHGLSAGRHSFSVHPAWRFPGHSAGGSYGEVCSVPPES